LVSINQPVAATITELVELQSSPIREVAEAVFLGVGVHDSYLSVLGM
jgi:hypothetical protein